ncbi:hypothetical protein PAEPH01_1359 [Pancytospora epiphaga]|nr:hypothetical protein PAEPH01_1359 [Pancytospora epiphaga]
MKVAITKGTELLRIFRENLHREYEGNTALMSEIEALKRWTKTALKSISPSKNVSSGTDSGFYNSSCLSNLGILKSLIQRFPSFTNDFNGKERIVDKILERNFNISQYYGGIIKDGYKEPENIWGKHSVSYGRQVQCPFLSIFQPKYMYRFKFFSDYKVLEYIENVRIPQVMMDVFKFRPFKDVSQDTQGNLKRLREEILKTSFKDISIELTDIRQTNIESVSVKNFKKVVSSSFEFTVILTGYDGGALVKRKQHFSGMLEFFKDNDGKWVASSFNYEIL